MHQVCQVLAGWTCAVKVWKFFLRTDPAMGAASSLTPQRSAAPAGRAQAGDQVAASIQSAEAGVATDQASGQLVAEEQGLRVAAMVGASGVLLVQAAAPRQPPWPALWRSLHPVDWHQA